jgi:hypothetical protein
MQFISGEMLFFKYQTIEKKTPAIHSPYLDPMTSPFARGIDALTAGPFGQHICSKSETKATAVSECFRSSDENTESVLCQKQNDVKPSKVLHISLYTLAEG